VQLRGAALVAIAAIGVMLAGGCAKSADSSSSTDASSTSASAAPAPTASGDAAMSSSSSTQTVASAGDPDKGKAIFAANCESCHGAAGAGGGVGPSLKNEKSRKDTPAAIAWIKNPQAPMPKLYPGTLSEKDVADVAAYVESL
jgi:mono/diheme cytochrome c family protein